MERTLSVFRMAILLSSASSTCRHVGCLDHMSSTAQRQRTDKQHSHCGTRGVSHLSPLRDPCMNRTCVSSYFLRFCSFTYHTPLSSKATHCGIRCLTAIPLYSTNPYCDQIWPSNLHKRYLFLIILLWCWLSYLLIHHPIKYATKDNPSHMNHV
jgi:hypothetical protein